MKKAMPVLAAVLLVLAVTGGTVGATALLTGKNVKNGSLTGADIKAGSLGSSLFSDAAQNALQGERGARGNRGIAGPAGTRGDTGASGAGGAVGAAGPGGVTGATGPNGAAGTPGAGGTNGSNGAAGATGATGAAGAGGTNGSNGATGTPGTDGTNGTNGTPGTNGTVTPLSATGGLIALATGAPFAPVVTLSVPAGNYIVLAKTQLFHSGAGDTITCHLQSGLTTIDQSSIETLPALASVAIPLQAVTTVVTSPTPLTVQCKVSVANGTANFSSLIAIPTA